MNQKETSFEVGTAELTEETIFQFRDYPTASWWHTTKCQPQTVMLTYFPYRSHSQFVWRFEGIREDEYFVNRIFNHSSVAEKKLGYTEDFVFHLDTYILADRIACDRNGRFGFSSAKTTVTITDKNFFLQTQASCISRTSNLRYELSK